MSPAGFAAVRQLVLDVADLATHLGTPGRFDTWTPPQHKDRRLVMAGPTSDGRLLTVAVSENFRYWTWCQRVPVSEVVARATGAVPFNGWQGRLFE